MPDEKSLVEIERRADEPKPVRWEDAPCGVLLRREDDHECYAIRVIGSHGIDLSVARQVKFLTHYEPRALWHIASRDECVIIRGVGR